MKMSLHSMTSLLQYMQRAFTRFSRNEVDSYAQDTYFNLIILLEFSFHQKRNFEGFMSITWKILIYVPGGDKFCLNAILEPLQ